MDNQQKINKLLHLYGQTFSDEVGIKLRQNSPSALFQLLNASVLFSARISHELSINTARHLVKKGLTTPRKVQQTSWEQRVEVLDEGGYARYREKTATFLGDIADYLQEQYRGDLRKLREQCDRVPARMREALKAFKGLGDTGVDIFFREVQGEWPELYPFAGKKSLEAAQKLDLPADASQLAEMVSRRDYPRLTAALLRAELYRDDDLKNSTAGHDKEQLMQKSKEELYQLAQAEDLRGRSGMNKKALAEALTE